MVEYQKYKMRWSLFVTALLVSAFLLGSLSGFLPDSDTGMASEVLVSDYTEEPTIRLCKLVVSQTASYDEDTLSTTLGIGEYSYYVGFNVAVHDINNNGCLVNIDGVADYIAVGQVQRVGSLFVTVRDVSP